MNQLIKFERGHMTRQNLGHIKKIILAKPCWLQKIKDRLREKRMSSRSIKRDDDEKEMAN